jgi:hypothetical protein
LNRLITRLDEVPPLLAHTIHIACIHGVTFINVSAEVYRPTAAPQKACAFEDGAVRKDSAAHVSLSSIQFSKSPEPKPHIRKLIRRQFATDN